MTASKIQWTDETWNPVRGCTKISPGCKNCYAETFAERWRGVPGHPYEQGFDLRLVPEKLDEPLKWKKPRPVFVNSMSDLFQDGVPFEFIDKVFAVMALCPQHTFQVLTKRPRRMLEYFSDDPDGGAIRAIPSVIETKIGMDAMNRAADFNSDIAKPRRPGFVHPWPLPNVWLGVSVENQQYADERIPLLLQTPAAKRFVSYEPALAGVDFEPFLGMRPLYTCQTCGEEYGEGEPCPNACRAEGDCIGACPDTALDWVIVGGESGPGARPFDVSWARSVVEQCKAAGVACFVKQLGKHPFDLFEPGLQIDDRKGGDMSEWPDDLRVREFPQ